MTYSEKLKDPRWQRKRLEILQRDDFTCQKCKDKETTLHVHHRIYLKGSDPWDYPDELLVTLCENCHEEEGIEGIPKQKILIEELLKVGVYSSEMDYLGYQIAESIKAIGYRDIDFLFTRLIIDQGFRLKIAGEIQSERELLKRLDDENPNPDF